MNIQRVIVSCDRTPIYDHFWNLIGKAWSKMGIHPTIVAVDGYQPDGDIGDVINFPNIDGVPSSFISQTVRLFAPIFYPNDICIISDIDMLPLNKKYFLNNIKNINPDNIVIYSSDAYKNTIRYPICYIVAKGEVFKEILGIDKSDMTEVVNRIRQWYDIGLGWDTDELLFTKALCEWKKYETHTILLKRGGWRPTARRRVDRQNSYINPLLLYFNYYIDIHMQRPFEEEKLKRLIRKVEN